ncbi:MAG: ferritin-like domain-containing protein [Planctomycetota bacterium]
MTKKPFDPDIESIREQARDDIERGAVTDAYRADRRNVVDLLNRALATELVCMLRYKHHQFMSKGLQAEVAAYEFREHATQEQEHADQIAARIVQLGGKPDFMPDTLRERSHADYVEGKTLTDMLEEDLVAERIAIGAYGEMIRYLGDDDPTTRRLLESILATEEEHADDLANLLAESS